MTLKANLWLGAGLVVVISALLVTRPGVYPAQNCFQKLVDLNVVAQIATDTGRLPGDPVNHFGAHYSVNPDVCK